MKIKKYWPLGLIIFIGILLRFYHNLDISLWHDEAFSALLIKYPWQEMTYRIGLDVHPPMYYIFLRFWNYIFGDSLLSLRGFSIFFSAGCIWAAWALVKEAFKNEKAALWAAVLVALNPFQLQYVTEARMYTFGAFFAILAAYFLVKSLDLQKKLHLDVALNLRNLPEVFRLRRKMLLSYLGFTLCVIIIIYTHYYLFFTAAALCFYGLVYLFFHHQPPSATADKSANYKKYIPLLSSFVVIVISFLPWLKTFLFQYRQVGAGYWIPPMNKWSIPSTFWDMLLGMGRDVDKSSTQFWLVIITLFSLFFLFRFLRKTQSFHKWMAVLAIAAPFLGAILFLIVSKLKGSNSSVYLDRYFLFSSVFYSIALAVWLKELKIKWLSISLFSVYIAVNLLVHNNYWKELDVKSRPGMNAAVKYLKANIEPNQKVYVGSSFVFFNLRYYLNQYDIVNKPLLYSGGSRDVSNMPHFAGTAILTNQDLLPDFKEGVKNGDTVWLIWTNGFGSNKPEVPKNWTQIGEKQFTEVRPYIWAVDYVTEYKVN